MKKDLLLIGAADSIGVPYTKDNHHHVGFFEMIEEKLAKEYNITTINCFHMSTNNDNHYIESLISNAISLFDIKSSQNKMLKQCKYSGIYPYLELPKSFLNHYKSKESDKQIIVKEYIKNHDTIFIYSAFVNDLLKSQKLSLFKLLRPGKIKKELKKIKINKTLNNLEKNINNLITINPNIKIFIIGLFVPTKISYIRKNLQEFISCVNESIYKITKEYKNVVFVHNDNLSKSDFNNIDFHPNKKGHEKMYYNFIKKYDSLSNHLLKHPSKFL